MNVTYFSISEKGLRPSNEDDVVCLHLGPGTYFFAVADGMGGVKGGEAASHLALQAAEYYLKSYFSNHFVEPGYLKPLLRETFQMAHRAIAAFLEKNPDYQGMGTTMTALLLMGRVFVWGNLGDSRIYQMGDHEVFRITRDHSYVEDHPDGMSQDDLPASHPLSHVLTRALDGGISEPDISPENKDFEIIRIGTTWVLCSDGLITDKAKPLENILLEGIKEFRDLTSFANSQVQGALTRGSTDNISVVVVRVEQEIVAADYPTKRIYINKKPKKGWWKPRLKLRKDVLFIVLLLILVVVFPLIFPEWFSRIFTTLFEKLLALLRLFLRTVGQ